MTTPNPPPTGLPTHNLLFPSSLHNRTRSTTPTSHRGSGNLQTRGSNHGSATQTITSTPTGSRSLSPDPLNTVPLVLRLRGAHSPNPSSDQEQDDSNAEPRVQKRRRIQWATTVIDNEGLGRKRSKVCCIYHKPRAVGESSSDEGDSSSGSSSSEDSDSDISDGARPAARTGGARGSRRSRRSHEHDHSHDDGGCKQGKQRRPPSPNAYEKMPKYTVKPLAG